MEPNQLTLYRDIEKTAEYVFVITRKFPSEYKYSIGNHLQQAILNMIDYIALANNDDTCKEQRLKVLKAGYYRFKSLINISYALRIISPKQLSYIVTTTESVIRQINGWIRYTSKQS